jgi:hypothetical protein
MHLDTIASALAVQPEGWNYAAIMPGSDMSDHGYVLVAESFTARPCALVNMFGDPARLEIRRIYAVLPGRIETQDLAGKTYEYSLEILGDEQDNLIYGDGRTGIIGDSRLIALLPSINAGSFPIVQDFLSWGGMDESPLPPYQETDFYRAYCALPLPSTR